MMSFSSSTATAAKVRPSFFKGITKTTSYAPSGATDSPITDIVVTSSDAKDDHMEGRMRVRTVVAFDPGIKNLAVWRGFLDDKGDVHTDRWVKVDTTMYDTAKHVKTEEEYKKAERDQRSASVSDVTMTLCRRIDENCHKSKGAYAVVSNVLSIHKWMYEGVDTVIIETQDPGNVPARIIAASIYGFIRAKFPDEADKVQFSGSRSKMSIKAYLAQLLGEPFDVDQCKGTSTSAKAYRTTKHTSYHLCKLWMTERGSRYERDIVTRYSAKTGIMKGDDLAEAYLLGLAELWKGCKTGEQEADAKQMKSVRRKRSSFVASVPKQQRTRRVMVLDGCGDLDVVDDDDERCGEEASAVSSSSSASKGKRLSLKPKLKRSKEHMGSVTKPDIVTLLLEQSRRLKERDIEEASDDTIETFMQQRCGHQRTSSSSSNDTTTTAETSSQTKSVGSFSSSSSSVLSSSSSGGEEKQRKRASAESETFVDTTSRYEEEEVTTIGEEEEDTEEVVQRYISDIKHHRFVNVPANKRRRTMVAQRVSV